MKAKRKINAEKQQKKGKKNQITQSVQWQVGKETNGSTDKRCIHEIFYILLFKSIA